MLLMVKCIWLHFHYVIMQNTILMGDLKIVANHVAIKSDGFLSRIFKKTACIRQRPCSSMVEHPMWHRGMQRSWGWRLQVRFLPWGVQVTVLTWSNNLLWGKARKLSQELTLEVFSLRTIGAVPKANFNIATLVDMEYQQLWSCIQQSVWDRVAL